MKTANVFGRLSYSVKEKLRNLVGKCGKKVAGKGKGKGVGSTDQNTKVKIWGVEAGPFPREYLPKEETSDIHNNFRYYLICLIEDSGVMENSILWFETREGAMETLNYFKSNITPLELEE